MSDVDQFDLETWLTAFRQHKKFAYSECNLLDVIADRERQLAEARAQQDRLQVVRDDCVQNESRLLAKITELERQLAEAEKNLSDLRQWFVGQDDKLFAAEAKLSAVAALRDEIRAGAHPDAVMRAVVVNRLDRALGGDK